MFHVDSNDRHEHIYRQQDGRNSGGKAGDQQQSTYQLHDDKNHGEHCWQRYAEMGEHAGHALQVEDVDFLISVHGKNNSYNYAKYGQTAGLRFQSVAHELLLLGQAAAGIQPEIVQR